MRPYLGPPWTDSHQIWAVDVFHHAPPRYGIRNAAMQKKVFCDVIASVLYSVSSWHSGDFCNFRKLCSLYTGCYISCPIAQGKQKSKLGKYLWPPRKNTCPNWANEILTTECPHFHFTIQYISFFILWANVFQLIWILTCPNGQVLTKEYSR